MFHGYGLFILLKKLTSWTQLNILALMLKNHWPCHSYGKKSRYGLLGHDSVNHDIYFIKYILSETTIHKFALNMHVFITIQT